MEDNMNLENNQEKQGGWGGARPGGGRPKGATQKPRFQDFITPEKARELVDKCIELAPEKPELMKFVLEQIFGKARQNIGLDGGEEGKALTVEISEVIAKKNDIDSGTV